MENTILNEASMVELWKTKCDSLRAFEPSAFYKDILASEPTDRYFFRGIKDSDIIYQILENKPESDYTFALISLTYSSGLFDEYKNPRLRDHFGKFSGIIIFDKGIKAYKLPQGDNELVYDYEKEAITFGKFHIKKDSKKYRIRSPLEEKGYYEVDLFFATPIAQNMDIAQRVQIEDCNRILKKYEKEDIIQLYQNYIIAKANDLDAKYIAVPDEASQVLIIDDNFLDSWVCVAYSWTFNRDYFYSLAEYCDINDFLNDILREHKRLPKKIIFKDRYFQYVKFDKPVIADLKVIFKNCEIGILDVCEESKFMVKLENTTVLTEK